MVSLFKLLPIAMVLINAKLGEEEDLVKELRGAPRKTVIGHTPFGKVCYESKREFELSNSLL